MGQPPVEGPKRKPDGIPAQVPQATRGLKRAIDPDIIAEELLPGIKTEGRGDAAKHPDTVVIVQDFAHLGQAGAMHEHDPIHELNIVLLARGNHFGQCATIRGAGLFADDMLVVCRRLQHEAFAQRRRQRNINRVHVRRGQ